MDQDRRGSWFSCKEQEVRGLPDLIPTFFEALGK